MRVEVKFSVKNNAYDVDHRVVTMTVVVPDDSISETSPPINYVSSCVNHAVEAFKERWKQAVNEH